MPVPAAGVTESGADIIEGRPVVDVDPDMAVQDIDGSYLSGSIETCALCHGPGRSADIRDAHKIDQSVDN